MPVKLLADLRLDPFNCAVFDDQPFNAALTQGQILTGFQNSFHPLAIEGLVCLRSGCSNGGAFSSVQSAELDPCFVDRPSHLAAERIDLFDQVAFAYTADRWVTGHLSDMIEIQRQHESLASHASCSETCLDTSVASANHYYVIAIDF